MPGGATSNRGSIPAGAGEPGACIPSMCRRRVYPRGCGGACMSGYVSSSSGGLSPRVRGSHSIAVRTYQDYGSIPAGAGEPSPSCPGKTPDRVYPRGCGGAAEGRDQRHCCGGLSPRVRGSHRATLGGHCRKGSIPAGAGEPVGANRLDGHQRVYPRGCGGASFIAAISRDVWGLSPRVRGSHQHQKDVL